MEWTDGRLDDLARRVDNGFNEVKGDIARLDGKIDRLDAKFEAKFDRLDTKFDGKIEQLHTLILRCAFGTVGGMVMVIVGARITGLLGG